MPIARHLTKLRKDFYRLPSEMSLKSSAQNSTTANTSRANDALWARIERRRKRKRISKPSQVKSNFSGNRKLETSKKEVKIKTESLNKLGTWKCTKTPTGERATKSHRMQKPASRPFSRDECTNSSTWRHHRWSRMSGERLHRWQSWFEEQWKRLREVQKERL